MNGFSSEFMGSLVTSCSLAWATLWGRGLCPQWERAGLSWGLAGRALQKSSLTQKEAAREGLGRYWAVRPLLLGVVISSRLWQGFLDHWSQSKPHWDFSKNTTKSDKIGTCTPGPGYSQPGVRVLPREQGLTHLSLCSWRRPKVWWDVDETSRTS